MEKLIGLGPRSRPRPGGSRPIPVGPLAPGGERGGLRSSAKATLPQPRATSGICAPVDGWHRCTLEKGRVGRGSYRLRPAAILKALGFSCSSASCARAALSRSPPSTPSTRRASRTAGLTSAANGSTCTPGREARLSPRTPLTRVTSGLALALAMGRGTAETPISQPARAKTALTPVRSPRATRG